MYLKCTIVLFAFSSYGIIVIQESVCTAI